MLMNNQLLFVCLWCCVSLDFAIQINFFSLVLFSAVIHKRRGKKLISKTIKYKLDSSSKMQFAFLSKRHSIFFMENYRFCGKSGNEANNKGWGIIFFCVIMTQCVRKSISDSPLCYDQKTFWMTRMWKFAPIKFIGNTFKNAEAAVCRCSLGVLTFFSIFTRKHLCWNSIKERLQHIFQQICESSFFTEHLRWLLLKMVE